MHPQCTDSVLMVRPVDFTYNVQTAIDNEFQHYTSESAQAINVKSMSEFAHAVNLLRNAGIEVLVVEKEDNDINLPDALFPNNWITTAADGTVCQFPMFAPNRRAEKRQWPQIEQLLTQAGFEVWNTAHIGLRNENQYFLEGTGSMVIDHPNKIIYAGLSERTCERQLMNYARFRHYSKVISFHTQGSTGKPFYHTNIMMSIGEGFALVCLECISDRKERSLVTKSLNASGKEVIPISLYQAENGMCGNALELCNKKGEHYLALSQTAYNALTTEQLSRIEQYAMPLPIAIPTIEHVGGGSIRCMLAEVFLPRAQQ